MANEINIQASLTFQRLAPSVVQAVGTKDVDQTSTTKLAGSNIQRLTSTSETDLSVAGVPWATIGFVFIKNLDTGTTLSVTVSHKTTAPVYAPFAKLMPQQFCLVPINAGLGTNNILSIKASTQPVDVLIVAVEQ